MGHLGYEEKDGPIKNCFLGHAGITAYLKKAFNFDLGSNSDSTQIEEFYDSIKNNSNISNIEARFFLIKDLIEDLGFDETILRENWALILKN